MYDGNFWSHYFRGVFVKQIAAFSGAVEKRLLPSFDSLEDEAQKIMDEFCENSEVPEDFDPGRFAEMAEQIGFDYFETQTGIKQSVVNFSVAALYHLFEQQVLMYHRRQILHPSQENEVKQLRIERFLEILEENGLRVGDLPSWPVVEELKLVANTVKHADGKSSAKLKKIRPELFIHPQLRQSELSTTTRVYLPLAGDDFYLSVDDLRFYSAALQSFWCEFASAIE